MPCTMPWIWYKISKALNYPKTAMLLVCMGIAFGLCEVYGTASNMTILFQSFYDVIYKSIYHNNYYDNYKDEYYYQFAALFKNQLTPVVAFKFIISIVFLIILTLVRCAYNKKLKSQKNLPGCCERCGGCGSCCLSCLEIWFCNPCVAGKMGKTLEVNGFDI